MRESKGSQRGVSQKKHEVTTANDVNCQKAIEEAFKNGYSRYFGTVGFWYFLLVNRVLYRCPLTEKKHESRIWVG